MTSPPASPSEGPEPDDRAEAARGGGESPVDAGAMSVDQLTQAFASLMGEDDSKLGSASPATDAVPQESSARPPETDAVLDDEASQVTPESIVEAILFVGHPRGEPLTSRSIASYLRGVSPREVEAIVEQLNQEYDQQEAPFQIIAPGAGYRMALRAEHQRLKEVFYGRVRQVKLTQAAVDLLAIVAYQQPITRDEVERLRGQASGGILAQLVRRKLLAIEHTKDKPRKKVYRTTERFLDLFGLESIDDLPSHEDF